MNPLQDLTLRASVFAFCSHTKRSPPVDAASPSVRCAPRHRLCEGEDGRLCFCKAEELVNSAVFRLAFNGGGGCWGCWAGEWVKKLMELAKWGLEWAFDCGACGFLYTNIDYSFLPLLFQRKGGKTETGHFASQSSILCSIHKFESWWYLLSKIFAGLDSNPTPWKIFGWLSFLKEKHMIISCCFFLILFPKSVFSPNKESGFFVSQILHRGANERSTLRRSSAGRGPLVRQGQASSRSSEENLRGVSHIFPVRPSVFF